MIYGSSVKCQNLIRAFFPAPYSAFWKTNRKLDSARLPFVLLYTIQVMMPLTERPLCASRVYQQTLLSLMANNAQGKHASKHMKV